jgi:hypothetical protein
MAAGLLTRLIVQNLAHYSTSNGLKNALALAGDVTDSKRLLKLNGKFRDFGLVGFRTVEVAPLALSPFHEILLDIPRITIDFAEPQKRATADLLWQDSIKEARTGTNPVRDNK